MAEDEEPEFWAAVKVHKKEVGPPFRSGPLRCPPQHSEAGVFLAKGSVLHWRTF